MTRAASYPFETQQLDFQRGVMLVDESGSSIYVLKFGAGWDTFQIPPEPADGYPTPQPQPEGTIYAPGGFFGELLVFFSTNGAGLSVSVALAATTTAGSDTAGVGAGWRPQPTPPSRTARPSSPPQAEYRWPATLGRCTLGP